MRQLFFLAVLTILLLNPALALSSNANEGFHGFGDSLTNNVTPAVNVYPNPVEDHMIWFKVEQVSNVKYLRIKDQMGQTLILEEGPQASFALQHGLNVSTLTTGRYVLELRYQEGQYLQMPIFVQR